MSVRGFLIGHGAAGAMVFFGNANVHGVGVVLMLANYTYFMYRAYREG